MPTEPTLLNIQGHLDLCHRHLVVALSQLAMAEEKLKQIAGPAPAPVQNNAPGK